MNLPTEIFGDVIVVHTPDEFGPDQGEQFAPYVARLERRNVVVDLDNTEMLDSGALTALLDAQDALRGEAGQVKIAASNSVNRKILEITRLDQRLEVFDSVVDAVKSFR
ncbi:MAG: STAS domain-containing protein [Pirellulales bacterium]|nr:STAS domain-containing protein [Pirellulales bacterium]